MAQLSECHLHAILDKYRLRFYRPALFFSMLSAKESGLTTLQYDRQGYGTEVIAHLGIITFLTGGSLMRFCFQEEFHRRLILSKLF